MLTLAGILLALFGAGIMWFAKQTEGISAVVLFLLGLILFLFGLYFAFFESGAGAARWFSWIRG